jgi:hypothetical protein
MMVKGNVFCVAVMVIVLLMVANGRNLTFHSKDAALDKMRLKVANDILSRSSYRLLWFDVNRRVIRVNCHSLLDSDGLELYALTPKRQISAVKLGRGRETFKLSKNKYSGTFTAVLPAFKKDLNWDGVAETVRVLAKVDTLFAPAKTIFMDPRIPLEIVKGEKAITLFFNQAPLANQLVRLLSRRGMDKTVKTDAGGRVAISDLRDLRKGISVVYRAPDQTCYIASYLLEAYSVFSPRHAIALQPLVNVGLIASGVAALLLLIRQLQLSYDERKYVQKGKLYKMN